MNRDDGNAIVPSPSVLSGQGLAFVWFDFDSLPPARARPIKTWARAKRLIAKHTDELIAASHSFIAQHRGSVAVVAASAGAAASAAVSPHPTNDALLTEFQSLLRKMGVAQ